MPDWPLGSLEPGITICSSCWRLLPPWPGVGGPRLLGVLAGAGEEPGLGGGKEAAGDCVVAGEEEE